MNRIFFRVFPLVMLAVTVATVLIYFAIRMVFGDPLEEIARKQAAGPIFLLQQYIDHAPADEWLTRLNKVREVADFSLELLPLKDALQHVSADQREALEGGELVLDISGKSFFRRVDLTGDKYVGSAEDVIHAQNLPIDVSLELKQELVRYVIVAFALLIPLGWWSRVHWLELQALSKVAIDFGDGNLSARAMARPDAAVYPLAQCMNMMAERIASLLDAQRTLLASVSHELRTPLARLGFGMELLRNADGDGALEPRIEAMEADLIELDALVSELLNLAKLDREHALQQMPFELADALHDCMRAVAHSLQGKHLEKNFPDLLGEISGDQRLIERAINNLILNALKYAEARVMLSARKLDGGAFEIAVEDDGPGIPADERKRVFEPFYRLDRSRDRATGGFGLGLSIAQKAVALHGGDISVGESPMGGARFVFVIPAAKAG